MVDDMPDMLPRSQQVPRSQQGLAEVDATERLPSWAALIVANTTEEIETRRQDSVRRRHFRKASQAQIFTGLHILERSAAITLPRWGRLPNPSIKYAQPVPMISLQIFTLH